MTKGIRMPNIQIQPVSYALGAAVTNIDLSKPVSSSDLKMIQDAWTQHVVLIFPDQKLDPKLLIEFTENFGELDNYATQPFNRHPEHDEVMLLSNKPVQGKIHPGANNGQNWHTDLSYTIRPAKATMVYCIEKPSVGGDTMFANMYAVYEALSPKMREFLDGLEGINDVGLVSTRRDPAILEAFKRMNPPVIHPAVRTHPVSGRRALYVNERVRSFAGMTEAESKPLIRFLCDFSVQPRFVYRHQWSVGDLVVWDNRCAIHLAVGDYNPAEYRHMIRTSTMGDYIGKYEDPHIKPPMTMDHLSHEGQVGVSLLHD